MIRFCLLVVLAVAGCSSAKGGSVPLVISGSTAMTVRASAPGTEKPDPADIKALEKTLRDLLMKNLPDPIVESHSNWGQQDETVVGVKFHKDGLRLRSEPTRAMRNNGTWRRVAVSAANPETTLAVGITDAAYPEPGRSTFSAMIGVNTNIKFEQQVWRHGARLYSGETRGRCRSALLLKCEVTSRTETKPGQLIPDVVVRVRATEAQLFYDDLVIEHTAGVGGDLAKVLGEAVVHTVKQTKPDLERDLLARANAAIVKAADTKDVRISFESLLKKK